MTISFESLNVDPNLPEPESESDPERRSKLVAKIMLASREIRHPKTPIKINKPEEVELNFHGYVLSVPESAIREGEIYCKPSLADILAEETKNSTES